MSTSGDESVQPGEQRRSPRYACVLDAARVTGQKTEYRPGWPVRVLDISNHGIRMHAGEALEVGTLLTIKLYNASRKSLPRLQVKVIHATPQANGTWTVGAEFIPPISDEQLQFLLS